MKIKALSDSMFIVINGLCLEYFQVERFVAEWIKIGHRSVEIFHKKSCVLVVYF